VWEPTLSKKVTANTFWTQQLVFSFFAHFLAEYPALVLLHSLPYITSPRGDTTFPFFLASIQNTSTEGPPPPKRAFLFSPYQVFTPLRRSLVFVILPKDPGKKPFHPAPKVPLQFFKPAPLTFRKTPCATIFPSPTSFHRSLVLLKSPKPVFRFRSVFANVSGASNANPCSPTRDFLPPPHQRVPNPSNRDPTPPSCYPLFYPGRKHSFPSYAATLSQTRFSASDEATESLSFFPVP